ncbi:tumor necrosis factor receptor superfamily member 14-like isoform X3 [Ctenopharyngodon idella]|uniref:tumor necrosis factor receptor superfamily member 14-like isoform X3 n=2 Tax=Ctenopharyngodon idella TaxID=7959 RepID=UPI0022315D5C|nr:tumor necrosis factor receptor superfamily member 14-like isoform X3 [Ctenopharyngodon idella]
MNMIKLGFILSITVVTLNFKLCFSACGRAEYEINGECCPMCVPGNRVLWHCTEYTSTTCVPCPELTYTDEPNGLTACFPCWVCDAEQGLRVNRTCTRSADTVCEPLEGFYCIEQNKGSCRFAVRHSECHPGQYIRQSGTAFTDTDCGNCAEGTYSNGSFTTCRPHSKCETEGSKEIKPGTMSSDVECEKSSSVSTTVGVSVGVIVGVIIGVLVTAVGIKLKQKRQDLDRDSNYAIPIPESNSAGLEERPIPEGACEPTSLDSETSLIPRNSSDIVNPVTFTTLQPSRPVFKSHSEQASQQNTDKRSLFSGMESEAESDHDKARVLLALRCAGLEPGSPAWESDALTRRYDEQIVPQIT